MSLTGNSSLSLKRKDVKEQKSLAVGFKKLVFAHKASLGDTAINLAALTAPTEMMALGFSNPTSGELLAAQLLFYKTNLTLVSSARGVLMQDLSYSVQTSTRILFNGFTALEGEIFTGVIDYNARNGINVVDAAPIVATGTLAIGATDFNVGTPFEVGKYSDISQVGQVVVYRNGAQMFRNTGNSSSVLDGNYYEVDAGSGLGVLIRFNTAPAGQSDSILVFSHGLLAYRPDSSALAVVENLAGQLDQIIPTVAALAGQPESNFRAAPNNVDLKAFGDRVLALENKDIIVVTDWIAFTPTGSWNTNVTYSGFYRRIGAEMEVRAKVLCSGAPNAANLSFNLPAGFTIDASRLPSTTVTDPLGIAMAVDNGLQFYPGDVLYNGGNVVFVQPYKTDATYATNATSYNSTVPFTFGSGDEVNVSFKVPIVGWAATAKLKDL